MNERKIIDDALLAYSWVKANQTLILRKADEGDITADIIMASHRLLEQFPEFAALAVLQGAVERAKTEWKEDDNNA